MKKPRIAIYGGFPPPINGQTLSNRALSNYLRNRGYPVAEYNTAGDFNQVGKVSLKKVVDAVLLARSFQRDSEGFGLAYMIPYHSKRGLLKFLPAIKTCRKKKIPYVIHLHGNLLTHTFERGGRQIRRVILEVLNNSKAVIVLSNSIKEQSLYRKIAVPVYVVSNFVDSHYFVSAEEKKTTLSRMRPLQLFFLGGVMKEKGILDVLETVLLLKKRQVEVKLRVAGRWKSDVVRKAERLMGLLGEDYVEYLGFVEGREKRSLILNSHVFLLPTYLQEGQPIALLEAMAGGNVIITTRWTGASDIIREGENGYFVRQGNPAEIAGKIESLCANPLRVKVISLNNIAAARGFTVERFSEGVEEVVTRTIGNVEHPRS